MAHSRKVSAIIILFIGLILCITSCKKEEVADVPVVTTAIVTDVTMTTALSGGEVKNDGGGVVKSRGVCWSTQENPTVVNEKTSNGAGLGIYTSNLTLLSPNQTYFVRAYATNSAGNGYGEQFQIKTYTGTVTDIDGNMYYTVTIGTQVWMAENLKTTKYANGNPIATTTPATKDISAEVSPKYQWAYNGNEGNVEPYGRLYTWHAVKDNRNVCPTGWHVPTDTEWQTLKSFLGGETEAGKKLKEAGTVHWQSPNTGATNETMFSAIPGGARQYASFSSLQRSCYYWSSVQNPFNPDWAWGQGMFYDSTVIYRGGLWRSYGHSVRCMKD